MFWWIILFIFIIYIAAKFLGVIQRNSPGARIEELEAYVIEKSPEIAKNKEELLKELAEWLVDKSKRTILNTDQEIKERIKHIEESISAQEDVKDKYIRLKEKYAHNQKKQLELAIDYYNYFFNLVHAKSITESLHYDAIEYDEAIEKFKEISLRNDEITKRLKKS